MRTFSNIKKVLLNVIMPKDVNLVSTFDPILALVDKTFCLEAWIRRKKLKNLKKKKK